MFRFKRAPSVIKPSECKTVKKKRWTTASRRAPRSLRIKVCEKLARACDARSPRGHQGNDEFTRKNRAECQRQLNLTSFQISFINLIKLSTFESLVRRRESFSIQLRLLFVEKHRRLRQVCILNCACAGESSQHVRQISDFGKKFSVGFVFDKIFLEVFIRDTPEQC